MQLISADLPSDFELIFFGDTHDGTILQHRDGIQVLIDYVLAKRNRYAVHLGDWLEAIMRDDKRYDDCTIQDKPLMQCSSTVKDFTPIKKRLLCGLSGNHEFKLHRFGNLAAHICHELGIPYGTYAAKIAMNDKHGLMFKAYVNHGFGRLNSNAKDPEQQIANMKANLKLKLKNKAADCAIMAMGHCFSEDTEMLTKSGWKTYQDINSSDIVLTFNTKTDTAEWQEITDKWVYRNRYKEMLTCHTNMIDFAVTEDHRVIHQSRHGHWNEAKAKEIIEMSTVIVPMAGKSGNEEYGIDDETLRIIGWFISEGHFRENGAVQLFQAWEAKGEIERILNVLEIPYTVYRRKFKGREFYDEARAKTYETNDDGAVFHIKSKDAKPILCFINEKQLPDYVFSLSDRQFEVLLMAMMAGDGHWQREGKSGQYYSGDAALINKLQAACMCHGWRTSMKHRNRRDRPGHTLNIVKTMTSSIQSKNKNRSAEIWHREEATPAVWCVTVPNGTVAVRRNGKAIFLGNTHKLLVVEPTRSLYLTDDGTKLKQHYKGTATNGQYIDPDERWYANTGSFLKNSELGEISYPEVAGYDPVELGFIVSEIHDRKITRVYKQTV